MKQIKDYYNKYQYPLVNLYTNRQRKRHNKLLSKILNYGNLKVTDLNNKKILDAGCGTGDKSVFFALNGGLVTSIDLTENQLKKAKELAIKNKVYNKIKFKQKDIVNDSLKNLGKFDIIVSTGVLHHTENAYKGFVNLSKLLKPNGVIIIALYHKYARWRYRFIRFMLHNLISKNTETLRVWLDKSWLAKPLRNAPTNSIFDRYLVPFESYFTLKDVKKWFYSNNIQFINNSSNVNGVEELKIFEKKTLFFVGGIKLK